MLTRYKENLRSLQSTLTRTHKVENLVHDYNSDADEGGFTTDRSKLNNSNGYQNGVYERSMMTPGGYVHYQPDLLDRITPGGPRPPPYTPRVQGASMYGGEYRDGHTLPGSLANKDHAPPPHTGIVSNTELDKHAVFQRGADERRPYLSRPSSQPSTLTRGRPNIVIVPESPPTTITQAWTINQSPKSNNFSLSSSTNTQVREAVSNTVEERLKNLLTTPDTSSQAPPRPNTAPPPGALVNGGFEDDNDELLIPPPRPRPPANYPDVHDGRGTSLSYDDDDHRDIYASSYIPSQPTDRLAGSRGQVLLKTSSISPRNPPPEHPPPLPPQITMPGQYAYTHGASSEAGQNNNMNGAPPAPPPRYQPPPQYGSRPNNNMAAGRMGGNSNPAFVPSPKPPPKMAGAGANTSSDLRNMCSRLYGGESTPTSINQPPPPARPNSLYATSAQVKPQPSPQMWHKYGGPESRGPGPGQGGPSPMNNQPRTSPMGQSSSTTPSQTSSQSPGSPQPQQIRTDISRPKSSMPEAPRTLDRRPSVPGNLDQRPLPSDEFKVNNNHHNRLSGSMELAQMDTVNMRGAPQMRNNNTQRTSYERSSFGADGTNHKVPQDRNSFDGTNGMNGIYAQVQHVRDNSRDSLRERSNSRERSQSPSRYNANSENMNRGKPPAYNSNPPMLPPKQRLSASPINHRRAPPPAPPAGRENFELHPMQSRQVAGGSIPKMVMPKVEYDNPAGLAQKLSNLSMDWKPSQNNNDNFRNGRYSPSISSSRSVTPPLPPLSPSNTPPISPPDSPQLGRGQTMVDTQNNIPGYLTRTPDVITSTAKKNGPSVGGRKKQRRISNGGVGVKTWDGRMKRTVVSNKAAPRVSHTQAFRNARSMGSIDHLEDESLDDDLTEDQGETTAASGAEDINPNMEEKEVKIIRQQLEGLETMYHEILKLLGVEKEYVPGSRRSISSLSSVSRTGRQRVRRSHSSHRHKSKEIKQINKRFARLESHVVTLARSVAHLSSEMRANNGLYEDMEGIKQEMKRLKELSASRSEPKVFHNEFERFRGWVPSLTNPRRVNKLTKFFGQEPPLLHIFLKKLGYEKYTTNFEQERIGMIELPYMNEERLQRIGIPMGPRLRILQEAQMCFRQENFDIYIV